jgi:uncharacterized protein
MSTIAARILEDMKTAMKAKDTIALETVRALKSAIKYAAIEKGGAEAELDEGEAIAVIRKEIKKRQDSEQQFAAAGRQELADKEKAEMAVLEKYLPAAMSLEELTGIIEAAIAETEATTKKDMGKVMKLVQERTAGRADGKTLSTEISKRLS